MTIALLTTLKLKTRLRTKDSGLLTKNPGLLTKNPGLKNHD